MNEIFSLNIDDLDVRELERRLEMAVAASPIAADCPENRGCSCPALATCGSYCTGSETS